MKLSRLIQQLTAIKEHRGDLNVYVPKINKDYGLVIHHPCNSVTVEEVDALDSLIVVVDNRRQF